jgi:ATP/maltotriose-dependent transcriptional regulator MalT
VSGSPGSELLSTKLAAPAPRPGLIPQTDLQARLQTALEAKLCLLDAPAGSGKTTLLAQWCATAGAGRVAWVSLDEGDNDPTRFWVYVAEALRTVEPNLGAGVLDALRRPSADLHRTVLPSLLNELGEAGSPLFLVLDDYHLITNPACHQSVGYFLDHLPAGVHVALAGRTDPPLPMPRMRVSGHMAELRVADLQFTGEEAAALLNGAMGLRLAPDDVERLAERTEGWAAGLYLAGAVASRPAGPERLRRRLPGRQPPHRRLPDRRSARSSTRGDPDVPAADLAAGAAVGPVVRRRAGDRRLRPRAGRAGAFESVPGAAGRPPRVVSLPSAVRRVAAPRADQP